MGVLGVVIAGGSMVAASTVLGLLGRFGWWLDLFSHFRAQYSVLLALAIVVCCLLGRWNAAIVFGAFLVVNAALIAPLYFGASEVKDGVRLRVMQLNVNARNEYIERVAEAIEQYDADLLLLEEVDTRWLTALSPTLASYPYSVISPRTDNYGIALFSRLPLLEAATPSFGTAGVPSVQASLLWQGRRLTFIGTHPPPPVTPKLASFRDEQLHALALHARSLEGAVLLAGDLNTTPWSHHFRRLVSVSGLGDCARGYGFQSTWNARIPLLRIPIDHCLHSGEITVVDKMVGHDVGSDHFPLIVSITL